MRIYECLDLPSSPNPFSQAGRRGTGLLLPSPKLGEGLGVRANPLCNDRSYSIHDPQMKRHQPKLDEKALESGTFLTCWEAKSASPGAVS